MKTVNFGIVMLTASLCNPLSNWCQQGYDENSDQRGYVVGSIQSRTHPITQGFDAKLWLSPNGMFGRSTYSYIIPLPSDAVGLEYPLASEMEHLDDGGLWIGALFDTVLSGVPMILRRVTTTNDASGKRGGRLYLDYLSETTPTDTANPWIHRSVLTHDSGAISESDYICEYTDVPIPKDFPKHMPLGIRVVQRSYAWAQTIREPILPIDYTIINIGGKTLRQVYVAFMFRPWVGPIYNLQDFYTHNVEGYWPELRTGYVYNPIDEGSTPVGITILDMPQPLTTGNFRFRWFDVHRECFASCGYPDQDSAYYDFMSGEAFPDEPRIRLNQSPDAPTGLELLFSMGPIETWSPGESLHVALGIELGMSYLPGAYNSLYDNTRLAHTLYARGYVAPVVLPALKLRVEQGAGRCMKLDWSYEGHGTNPEEVWDSANATIEEHYSPDNWRRMNPPGSSNRGGRPFLGYRLYRSEDPTGATGTFVLLQEWRVDDSLGPPAGLVYQYTDTNLAMGKVYWYSVTTLSLPDAHAIDYLDFDGQVHRTDVTTVRGSESSLLALRVRSRVNFAPSSELGKVLVVPNPYRVDVNYTFESGGYEGRAIRWTENQRLLKFIHLPQGHSTVRIYSLSGDVVATLSHDSETEGGELDWNMLNESNRAIASGVYVFTVESEFGTQTGKFVVIR